mgnify:CR=1 FL=1
MVKKNRDKLPNYSNQDLTMEAEVRYISENMVAVIVIKIYFIFIYKTV